MCTSITSSKRRPLPELTDRIAASPALQYAFIFAIALGLRLLYLHQISGSVLFETLIGDGRGYDAWAQRILAPGEQQDAFYQAPLYPYFLAGIYRVWGHDILAVRVVQAILGALSCVFVAGATRTFFSHRAAWIAGLLLAFYPLSFYYDGVIQKTSLAQFFTSLLLFSLGLIASAENQRITRAFAIGAVLGALSLLRENSLALAPICLLWLGHQVPRGQRVVLCAVFVLGMLLVLTPFASRNYLATGALLPTSSQFGANFYIGNHTGAPGHYVPLRAGRGDALFERNDAHDLAEEATGEKLNAAEVSRYWTEKTLREIKGDIPGWLRLLAWKWALVWNATEISDTDTWRAYADYSWLLSSLGFVFHFGVLFPLAAWGIAGTWQRRSSLWVLYAVGLALTMGVAGFFVFGRYRFPLVLVLIPFAGAALAGLGDAKYNSPFRKVRCVLFALGAAVFANWPMNQIESDPRAVTYNSLGMSEQAEGRLDSALALYSRALELEPALWWAEVNVARTFHMKGNLKASARHFRKALERRADPILGGEFGLVLLKLGQPRKAAPLLELGIQHDPQNSAFHNGLGAAHVFLGDLHKARRHFAAALRLDPGNIEATSNLEVVEQQLRRQ